MGQIRCALIDNDLIVCQTAHCEQTVPVLCATIPTSVACRPSSLHHIGRDANRRVPSLLERLCRQNATRLSLQHNTLHTTLHDAGTAHPCGPADGRGWMCIGAIEY